VGSSLFASASQGPGPQYSKWAKFDEKYRERELEWKEKCEERRRLLEQCEEKKREKAQLEENQRQQALEDQRRQALERNQYSAALREEWQRRQDEQCEEELRQVEELLQALREEKRCGEKKYDKAISDIQHIQKHLDETAKETAKKCGEAKYIHEHWEAVKKHLEEKEKYREDIQNYKKQRDEAEREMKKFDTAICNVEQRVKEIWHSMRQRYACRARWWDV
jgi:apoptotic chromatin condensation inducer in the nucleus